MLASGFPWHKWWIEGWREAATKYIAFLIFGQITNRHHFWPIHRMTAPTWLSLINFGLLDILPVWYQTKPKEKMQMSSKSFTDQTEWTELQVWKHTYSHKQNQTLTLCYQLSVSTKPNPALCWNQRSDIRLDEPTGSSDELTEAALVWVAPSFHVSDIF